MTKLQEILAEVQQAQAILNQAISDQCLATIEALQAAPDDPRNRLAGLRLLVRGLNLETHKLKTGWYAGNGEENDAQL